MSHECSKLVATGQLIINSRWRFLAQRKALIGQLLVQVGTTKGCDWLTQQRKFAWPQRKDDTQIREAFQIFFHFQFENESTGVKLSIFMLISARGTTTITSLATFSRFTTRQSCTASTVEFQQLYNWHKVTLTSMPNSLNRECKVKLNLF